MTKEKTNLITAIGVLPAWQTRDGIFVISPADYHNAIDCLAKAHTSPTADAESHDQSAEAAGQDNTPGQHTRGEPWA